MAAIACIFRALFLYIVPCIVMVVCSGADCHSKKTRPGANIFFFPSPYSVFLWYKEFHGTIQFGISFLRPPQYIVYHISGWKIYQKATLNLSMQSLSSNEQFLQPGPSVACLQLGRGASKFWRELEVEKSLKSPNFIRTIDRHQMT